MKIQSSIISILANALFMMNAHAQQKQGGDLGLYLGTSFSKNETLTIKQQAYPDITLDDVSFSTKPFDSPLDYGIRLGEWKNGHAWEAEHIHEKIYVDDQPADVQYFEITDGYTLFQFNSAWQPEKYGAITRLGTDAVIADPQITVSSLSTHQSGSSAIPTIWDLDSSYQWDGPAIQTALEKEFSIGKYRLLSIKSKWTGPAIQTALVKEFSIGKHWLLSMEGKLTMDVLQSVRAAAIILTPSSDLLSGRCVLSGRY